MPTVVVVIAAAAPTAVGLLVIRRQPRNRVGWLLVAHGVSVGALIGLGGGQPSLALDQVLSGIWVFLFLWLVLVAYLLPDGRAASTRWRRWVQVTLVGVPLFLVGAAGDTSGFTDAHDGAEPPVPWLPETASDLLGTLGLALVVLLIFGSVPAVRSRLRRSAGEVRLQLLWLLWGALTVPLTLLTGWANYFLLHGPPAVFDVALLASAVVLPVTIGIAVLRHRLFDIEWVLSRTLTYGALTLALISVYAGMLLATGRLLGSRSIGGLLAVGVVAVATHPAYSWLRARIERWVYGYRSDPHLALRLLADRADSAEPHELSASITTSVARAMRAERVWIESEPGGDVDDRVVRAPLVHRGERLGDLAVMVPAGRRLSPADVALLDDLARHAAVLVRSERQSEELRESRARIVAGREEERRSLRRDLHDGVGPALAAIVLKLNAVRTRSEAEREELLAEARDEVRAAIAELRRLVDGLRPPAIDEVGLVAAIRQRAAALSAELPIEVEGPDSLPALPAAVEVVAFRIASEAMTNVARHSDASRCRVTVAVNGAFELTVADNGRGADRDTTPGVGWTSMRERAAELGGSCTISTRSEGGLVVRAVLPLEQPVTVASDLGSTT